MDKALLPIKAAPLDPDEDKAFWAGKIPRRLLAIPFGGPISSPLSPRGRDIDGEFFDETTDIFGSYRVLRQDPERLVDFHHSLDPTKIMGTTVIGKSMLDPNPDEDGWWVDFWVKAGEKRVALVKALSERAQLFGSSQITKNEDMVGGNAKRYKPSTNGHISVWPFLRETISTSPQNTLSVFAGKAVLDEIDASGIAVTPAMRALLAEQADLGPDLLQLAAAAKAGRELSGSNEAEIEAALDEFEANQTKVSERLRAMVERVRARYRKETNG